MSIQNAVQHASQKAVKYALARLNSNYFSDQRWIGPRNRYRD